MADTSNLTTFLGDVADAIREKRGTELPIPAANFDTEIRNIQTGMDTSDATATTDDIINPKTAYVNGQKLIGNIKPEILNSSLSLDNKTLNHTTTNNYVFDYNLDYDISVSCTSNINMTSFNVKTSTSNKDFNVSEVFEGYTYIDNINIAKNTTSDTIELIVLIRNESNTSNLALLQLSSNLDVTNTYINTSVNITYTDNSNFVYNYPKNLYCLVTTNPDSRKKYIYIYTFTINNSIINFNSALSYVMYNRTDYNTDSKYIQCTWSPNGEHLSVCYQYDYMNRFQYIFAILNFNTALTSVSSFVIANTIDDGNASRYKRVFLTDEYIIDGNTIYKFNTTSLEQFKTVNLSNITNIHNYDYAYTINNIFYLYFSVNNAEIYVYKYDDLFNFTYIKSIPYSFNSSKLLGNVTLDEGKFVNENNIIMSSNNILYNVYTTSNSVDFASLEKNNIKYYNTTDCTTINSNVLSGNIYYNNNGKQIGTMPNNGELNYNVSTSEQTIPAGYTSGGTVAASPLTEAEYESCLGLSEQILGENISL